MPTADVTRYWNGFLEGHVLSLAAQKGQSTLIKTCCCPTLRQKVLLQSAAIHQWGRSQVEPWSLVRVLMVVLAGQRVCGCVLVVVLVVFVCVCARAAAGPCPGNNPTGQCACWLAHLVASRICFAAFFFPRRASHHLAPVADMNPPRRGAWAAANRMPHK